MSRGVSNDAEGPFDARPNSSHLRGGRAGNTEALAEAGLPIHTGLVSFFC